jgi:2-dehydropantoate 2-reductase
MRIGIMGSGGLGGYFGAKLAHGGADVHFIARGRHLEAMRRDGLRIEGPQPLHLRDVKATGNPADAGVMDVVMLGVKLWDTEQAIAQMRPMVGPQTAVISFQNGVLKDQYLRAAFDPKQIMGGVGYVATTIEAPGVIRQTGPMQRLILASSTAPGRRVARPCSPPAWPAASTRSSPLTSCARSGRSTCSWSACRAPPPPCDRGSGRSAPTRRPAPSCRT